MFPIIFAIFGGFVLLIGTAAMVYEIITAFHQQRWRQQRRVK